MLRRRPQFKGVKGVGKDESGVGKAENEMGEAGMLNTTNTNCRK